MHSGELPYEWRNHEHFKSPHKGNVCDLNEAEWLWLLTNEN